MSAPADAGNGLRVFIADDETPEKPPTASR